MEWTIVFCDEFAAEFEAFPDDVQDELYAKAVFLKRFGPSAGRPQVDTLKGSRWTNMKELRFDAANGVWRVAFIFDAKRRAVLLVAGDKAGVSEKKFYQRLIAKAEERYARYVADLERESRAEKGRMR